MRKGLAHHPDSIGYIHMALYALFCLLKGDQDIELNPPSMRSQDDLWKWINEESQDAKNGKPNINLRDLF